MRSRLFPVWGYFTAINATFGFIMCKPLRADEIKCQIGKRLIMGKFLYSTFHLDPEEQKHMSFTLI